jgi:hypothetical protein
MYFKLILLSLVSFVSPRMMLQDASAFTAESIGGVGQAAALRVVLESDHSFQGGCRQMMLPGSERLEWG